MPRPAHSGKDNAIVDIEHSEHLLVAEGSRAFAVLVPLRRHADVRQLMRYGPLLGKSIHTGRASAGERDEVAEILVSARQHRPDKFLVLVMPPARHQDDFHQSTSSSADSG